MSKIDQYGGGLCSCFDDIGICAITCLAPCVTWGQAMENAGEGSCLIHGVLLACIPCWMPVATAMNQENIDKKLGGQGKGFVSVCCTHCCCSACAICQVARAVNRAKAEGLLKNGAPAEEEMEK